MCEMHRAFEGGKRQCVVGVSQYQAAALLGISTRILSGELLENSVIQFWGNE